MDKVISKILSSSKSVSIVLIVLFFALITLSNIMLKHVRLDLTENKIYTLSDGTRNIISAIDQPLNLYLFFTEEASRDVPYYRKYYHRVREILEEYKLYADDKIRLHFINPEPFSEDEDRATGFGIQRVPLEGGSETLYFGLAGSNAVGDVEEIAFLDPRREVFLEYDIDKLLYTLMNPEKPVLGLMSTLPMYPVAGLGAGSQQNPWVIIEQIEQLFEVKLVFPDTAQIDDDVDVLMVVHPKQLEEKTLYAIDQYVMKGGNTMFFVDPHAEIENIPTPSDMPLQNEKLKSSTLNNLFRKWGFEVPENTIVADFARALRLTIPGQGPKRNIIYLGLNKGDMDREDVVTSALEQINFAMSSHIKVLNEEQVEMIPLMRSSKQSGLLPLSVVGFMRDSAELEKHFNPTNKQYPIVARLKGEVNSAFEEPPTNENEGSENSSQPPTLPHLKASVGPVNLLVVADVDILSDRLWVIAQEFFGQRLYQPIANNRDFVVNAIDNMTGGKDLIGIRSRASFNRPFTKVAEIEQQANMQYREVEKQLQRKLKETEEKLQELQEQRTDKKGSILNPKQVAEYQKFQKQRLQTRKQLREVKYNLAKDIDLLGRNLKIINIGAMPAVITALALVFVYIQRRRRL